MPPAEPDAPAVSTSDAANPAEYARRLSHKMWCTRGARLNAYRRLGTANDWSLRAITFLSLYAIIATLALTVPTFGLTAAEKDVAGVVLTGFSILILVLSLLEAPRNYLLRADRLHRCALELGELINRLDLASAHPTSEERDFAAVVRQANSEYAAALARCPENHEPLDDALFRAQYPKDFPATVWSRRRTRVRAAVGPYAFYYLLIYGPPVVLAGRLLLR